MLRIRDVRGTLGRRSFLQIGSLGLGGLSLANMLQVEALLASGGKPLTSGRSVIFLFLHGGPSQTETFDPKMGAPAGVRSATGEVSTNLPGISFGGTFPELAARADKLSIVRSFRTGDAIHNIKPIVDRTTLGANMGSLFARVAGSNAPGSGMPRNVVLFPRAVDAPQILIAGRTLSQGDENGATKPLPGVVIAALHRSTFACQYANQYQTARPVPTCVRRKENSAAGGVTPTQGSAAVASAPAAGLAAAPAAAALGPCRASDA